MKDLIEALQIFLKYGNAYNPTHCEHDVMMVHVEKEIDEADIQRLEELSFTYDASNDCYTSYRFGSA